MLFIVQEPTGDIRLQKACTQIRNDLEALGTVTLPMSDKDRIVDFARIEDEADLELV